MLHGILIHPAYIQLDTPTCDVTKTQRRLIFKRLVMANHTHTWWNNITPLKAVAMKNNALSDIASKSAREGLRPQTRGALYGSLRASCHSVKHGDGTAFFLTKLVRLLFGQNAEVEVVLLGLLAVPLSAACAQLLQEVRCFSPRRCLSTTTHDNSGWAIKPSRR